MNSSPFKQSYRTVENQDTASENTLNIVNNLGQLNEDKKKKVGNYSIEMQQIIDNGGELPAAEYTEIFDTLKYEMQPSYTQANSQREKALLQREQTIMAESVNDFSGIKTKIAQLWDENKLSSNWKNTQRGRAVLEKITSKNSVLTKKGCPEGEECRGDEGELGVMMPDFGVIDAANDQIKYLDNQINELESSGIYDDKAINDLYSQRLELQNTIDAGPLKWTSIPELESMVKEVDEPAKQGIMKGGQDWKKIGMNSNPEDNIPFNRADAKDYINKIQAKSDKESLIYDEMIDGRVFYNDLVNWIKGSETGGRTYKDLGITDLQLEDADINADGIIDDNEAKNLANALINNKEVDGNGKLMIDNYLSDYYVNFLENQHKLGVNNMKKKVDPDAPGTPGESGYEPPVKYEDLDVEGKRIWNKLRNENKASKYIPGSLGKV